MTPGVITPLRPSRRGPSDTREPSYALVESLILMFALVCVTGLGLLLQPLRAHAPALAESSARRLTAGHDSALHDGARREVRFAVPFVISLDGKPTAAQDGPRREVRQPPGFVEVHSHTTVSMTCSEEECRSTTVQVRAFFLGRTEVTQQAYERCVRARRCRAPKTASWAPQRRPQHPVTGVSIDDARGYCSWLSQGGRLPTELEWERAAAGADDRTYAWGNTPPASSRANISRGRNKDRIRPVGTAADGGESAPGPYSTVDQSGNVAEWVEAGGDEAILKGGSVRSPASLLRVEAQRKVPPGYRSPLVGFRCAWFPPASGP